MTTASVNEFPSLSDGEKIRRLEKGLGIKLKPGEGLDEMAQLINIPVEILRLSQKTMVQMVKILESRKKNSGELS